MKLAAAILLATDKRELTPQLGEGYIQICLLVCGNIP
jgi:hypothetical protein